MLFCMDVSISLSEVARPEFFSNECAIANADQHAEGALSAVLCCARAKE